MKAIPLPKRKEGGLVFIVFLLFFILTRTANFSSAHDSIDYLNNLNLGTNLFINAHLLYHITAYGFMKAVMALHLETHSYYAVELMDSIWASGSMMIVYLFFRNRFGFNGVSAFISTWVPALSFGFWFYATNIEVYMPPLLFLLCAMYILTKKSVNGRNFILVAVLHSLAIMYHQSNIIFLPVVLFRMWQSRDHIRIRVIFAAYAGIGILMVAGSYLGISWFALGYHSWAGFHTWFTGMATQSDYWNPVALSTLVGAWIGFSHSFIGGHFIFNLPVISGGLQKLLYYHSLDDEMFLVRHLSKGMSVLIFAVFIIFLFIMILLVTKLLVQRKRIIAGLQHVTGTLTVFLIVYSIFFFFWMPSNLEFWINQSVIFWVLILGMSFRTGAVWKFRQPYLSLILAVCLFLINFIGSLYWLENLNNDLFYRKVQYVSSHSHAGDLILLRDSWQLEDYLNRYSADSTAIIPAADTMSRSSLPLAISRCLARGGKVFFFDEEHIKKHVVTDNAFLDYLEKSYGTRMKLVEDPYSRLFEIH